MCRFCQQTRRFVRTAWHKVIAAPEHSCAIRGCTNKPVTGWLCLPHWRALPLPLRQRWWKETEYSTQKPSIELVAEVNHAISVATKPKSAA